MANSRFQNNSSFTKQLLVDYQANSLAPYTILDCISDVGVDDDITGMKLIYNKINDDITLTKTSSLSEITTNQYLLVWDDTDTSNSTASKFKLLGIGGGSSGSGSGTSGDIAEYVFGQDGKFHNSVKYASCLYNAEAAPNTTYVPFLSVGGTVDNQRPGYLAFEPVETGEVKALTLTSSGLSWGSAGAKMRNLFNEISQRYEGNATDKYCIIGTSSGNNGKAPSELHFDSRIYFMNGSLYHASDESLKTFTGDIDINLDNLATIKKGMFYWNSDPDKMTQLGVTAQSVEALYPELVSSNEGHLSVDYSKLSVVALAAIDKLNERIKELEKQIEELKK